MFEGYRFIDLTHVLSPSIPTWNGSCGFCLEVKKDYDRIFRVQQMKLHAGAGTHMDAPSHRFEKGRSMEEIPLENFFAPAFMIDVSSKAHSHYQVTVSDLEEFEKKYANISPHSLVILHTGWDRFWSHPDAYRGLDASGQMHFPSCSSEATEYLLEKNIAGLAIDTLSPDAPHSDFPVHRLLLGAGKYIIENLANSSKMPPYGGHVIALPLRAEGATESPLRVVGVIKKY